MDVMEAVSMMVTLPVVFGVMGWGFKILLDFFRQRRMATMMFDLQNKVIDKFGTAPEALQYLESEAGRRLLETASTGPTHPRMRVLASIQIGVVLAAVAVGFLLVRGVMPEAAQGFTIIGVLGACVGAGFLVSGAVAYWLSKSWGLINGGSGSNSVDLGL
ncbi:MAG: hypothetical protein DRJ65_15715 [Acidobacteria bacterium]|nr:MAG: hypothetical protein DRJ65_15715 [Acidobacteriota bacterium]